MKNQNYIVSAFNPESGKDEFFRESFTRKDAIAQAKQLRSTGTANVRVINYIKHSLIDA